MKGNDNMDINEKVKQYINQNLIVFDHNVSILDEDDIFKLGFVNSLFAMKLIVYIESEFKIEIGNDDMYMSNFNSIKNIVNFIKSKIDL